MNSGARTTICLVTPGHLATNPRLVKEADALHAAGYRVAVVAARFVGWADEADQEFAGRAWPVHRTTFGPLAPRPVWLWQGGRRRLALAVFRAGLRGERIAEWAFHPAVGALARLARRIPADLYIAHNLAALPAAGRAALRQRALLGFDAEDYHLGEMPEGPQYETQRRLVRAIEGRWLPRCTHRTAAAPGIARALAATYGIAPPVVVRNVFPLTEAPTEPQAPSVSPGPAVYWFSQTLGPGRGLEAAIRALAAAASRPHLYLRGNAAAGYPSVLDALARAVGVAERVHLLPPVRPGTLVRDAARFHAGLACEVPVSENRKHALTNKVFTYLLAGIPVLLSGTPAQAELAADLGAAAVLFPPDDAGALAQALDTLFLDAQRYRQGREAAWTLGRHRFNWEREQREFLASVELALAERRP